MGYRKLGGSFDQLMGGAVSERVDVELQKLWDNVYDMRTAATAARKLTLTICVKPNAGRDAAGISYDVKLSPAKPEALQQTVFIRQRDDGTVIATEVTEQVPGQVDMDGQVAPVPNVVEFKPIPNSDAN